MEELESVETVLSIHINRTTCIIYYLSKTLNIDISYLYFLYKKFGEDMFYFFFMLSGKKITIPKEEKFVALIKNADEIYEKITKNPNKVLIKAKDLEIYQSLIDNLDNESLNIEF